MTRKEALIILADLSESTLEAFAFIVETADHHGECWSDAMGGLWNDIAIKTLNHLADNIRNLNEKI